MKMLVRSKLLCAGVYPASASVEGVVPVAAREFEHGGQWAQLGLCVRVRTWSVVL